MYPDWPRSKTDLVPLPQVDGPRLDAFDFHGPQKIEFLEYLGEGSHAHVVEVNIKGKEYALKLFRFLYDSDWLGPGEIPLTEAGAGLTALARYSEPFNCECRAFARLQETGHTYLALECYGYVLLDEEHERVLQEKFQLEFNGNMDDPGLEDMRGRFLGERSGKAPPIRGILKELGKPGDNNEDDPPNLTVAAARKILQDTIAFQQLGIIYLDVRRNQLFDNRFCDLSTAVTIPHFIATPELNPKLSQDEKTMLERETFRISRSDYTSFIQLLLVASLDKRQTSKVLDKIPVFPAADRESGTYTERYNMRSSRRRQQEAVGVFTYVDPRKYDWKATSSKTNGIRRTGKRRRMTAQYRIPAHPQRWYCDFPPEKAQEIKYWFAHQFALEYRVTIGLVFPELAGTGEYLAKKKWEEKQEAKGYGDLDPEVLVI
ncbi:hypothetical protein SEUCBS140593_004959 [Sporothrix eucalyptigena]|uniref:Protein kinase domain-containing protein n=1 Tax=Sporothrix eucalyptigena TaxID=1812306 RepID=A0ABP0BT89_9PEZI